MVATVPNRWEGRIVLVEVWTAAAARRAAALAAAVFEAAAAASRFFSLTFFLPMRNPTNLRERESGRESSGSRAARRAHVHGLTAARCANGPRAHEEQLAPQHARGRARERAQGVRGVRLDACSAAGQALT